MNKHVIVGTAGHIDHGKSALVEALTGTHPDRLEEEKRRGITIDLGFAFLQAGDVALGFVDVPGHERFVRNMLAGAGGIDLVLLVVAADEGIKPQTHEHFDICRLLGISRGIIAITKADLVEPDVVGLVKLEIEEFIRGSFLEGAPIVAVSARTGAGLDELKRQLERVAQSVPPRDLSSYPRLPIDRAFAMKGFGTVVTGTLISGTLRAGQEVELIPLGRRLRVRGIHSGGQAVALAEAGQRTAVNLADVAVADIQRGMVLTTPGLFHATRRLDARLTLLPSARPLKTRARVHFHQGTAETVAEVALPAAQQLAPGDSALAQLRLVDPVFVLPGDRFIVRQFSPVETIGGGVVLDALAPRHKQGDPGVIRFLDVLEKGSREEMLAALAEEAAGGLSLREIIPRTGWQEPAIRHSIQVLSAAQKVRVISADPFVIASAARFIELGERIVHEVEAFHKANPLVPGISKEELRGRAAVKTRQEMYQAALDDLVAAKKMVLAGDLVQKAGREIALSPEEARAKERIAKEFESAGLAVPAVSEVLAKLSVDAQRAQKLMQILLREKTLVKVTDDLVFHRSAVEKLRGLLSNYKRERGEKLPIAAFKEMAGISRKYAIPLLEYLDRERLTRRVGDERVIL
ncbi:MAG TPA: selenocysteine-specific translation elongation factor [Candidatus Acidoferrales bacterium]|nr:selenocysteine-specific translation elongation factor [Candidatus Acidoferrales bacterium]